MAAAGESLSAAREHAAHWRRTLRLTAALLAVWFVVSFGVAWFARDLEGFTLFGFPFPVWVASQGGPLVYLLLIGVYARRMNRLDEGHAGPED